MTKWISQLARKLGFRGTDLGAPCIVLVRKGDVRMSLLEFQLPCNHSGFGVELEFRVGKSDEWHPIGMIRDYELVDAVELLREAQTCIDNLHAMQE